jgi:type I restriction-modification system DNA methylase subunit
MNLAIRGIDGQIGHGDSFHNDRHPDLKADFILANPPFNISDWGGERLQGDKRWQYGVPPAGNANYAWVQHMVHHLAPAGVAGFVLANGSMSSNQSGEGEIRKNLIEADLVDCMVALPGQLFYSTQIPACLWFIARDRRGQPSSPSPLPAGEGHYRGGFDFSGQLELARGLRRRSTPAEALAWELLRDRRFLGLKFRRQHQIGDYVVDFYCDEKKLVVEFDGPVHANARRHRIDHKRDAYLLSAGMTVLRIPNQRLLDETEAVLNEIAQAMNPSPLGRGPGVRGTGFRDRRGEILFVDARKLGRMADRTHRELTDEDVVRIAGTYHAWRCHAPSPRPDGHPSTSGRGDWGEGNPGMAAYADIPGFCKSAPLEEVRKHGHVLTPGRYVGAEAQEDDGEPFEEKMKRLTATLREQQAEAEKLDAAIAANLKELGYGG